MLDMEEEKKEIIEVEKINETENNNNIEKNENVKTETAQTKVSEEPKKEKKGFCIASMILGIVALIFFCIWYISIPCGILAIIFGILGVKTVDKGMAIAGLITGSIGLVISSLIVMALFAFGFVLGITDALEEVDYDDYRTYEDYEWDYDYK